MCRFFAVAAITFLVISGCAQPPTPEQLAAADYGAEPTDYQEIIKKFLHKSLYDPYSAMYENWRGPEQGYYQDVSGTYFGYRACVDLNAKNRMGGYVGSRPLYFLIKNGEIIRYLSGTGNTYGDSVIENRCKFF